MNKNILSTLKQYGLTDKEAAVYLACLELGAAKIQDIADKSQIKRTTVYLITDALKEKGLLAEYEEQGTLNYIAEEPQQLLRNFEERKQKLKGIIPELEGLANRSAVKPQVKFYKGKEGILKIAEDTLSIPNSEVLFLSSLTDIYRLLTAHYDETYYIPKRLEKNIRYRALVTKDPRSMVLTKNDSVQMRETHFLPPSVQFSTTQFIYNNKVAIIAPKKEIVGIIIESIEIAEMEKQKFEFMWLATSNKQ